MVRVTVTSAAGRKSDNFGENQTPREIFEAFGVDYSVATNCIDGVKMSIGDMDKTLRELGVRESCRLSSVVKIDNAAHVDITGGVAVVVSDFDLEDWERVEKYAPEALKIVEEESGDTLFKVMTGHNGGSMNKYGVEFGSYTNEGKATVTVLFDESVDDKKQAIKDTIGSALLDLNEIEKELPEILKDIDEKTLARMGAEVSPVERSVEE